MRDKLACEISSVVEIILARDLRPATTWSTAMLTPRRRSIGFSPAATLLLPSLKMARVSTVAVVVPAADKQGTASTHGPGDLLAARIAHCEDRQAVARESAQHQSRRKPTTALST